MKKILFALLLLSTRAMSQICNPAGNIVIFSNYDGGTLNINVDVDITNLKIGIVSYEAVEVNFSGPFVGNITEVEYAGYNNSPNTNCTPSIPTTAFTGEPGGVTPNIVFAPAAPFSDPDGYDFMVCAYDCASGSMGGCNTPEQVYAYFEILFSGLVYSHETQYPCWIDTDTQNLSDGGNCCMAPAAAPVANFSMLSDSICIGDCVEFTDLSTNIPTDWDWTFVGAAVITSTFQDPVACYYVAGTYDVTLIATNATGNDMITIPIVVGSADIATSVSGITITADAIGAIYQWVDCSTMDPIPGETSSSFTPAANGSYAVIVTENGCTDTSACTDITSVGLTDVPVSDFIRVYPNPSTGIFTIDDTRGELSGQAITVGNLVGEIIYRSKITSQKTQLDLSNKPEGVYFISVTGQSGKLVTRITKE